MKPILFNTPMTQATQENRKTETRRDPFQVPDGYEYQGLYWVEQPKGKRLCAVFHHADGTDINIPARYCPGDILWVRETWQKWAGEYHYKADYNTGRDVIWTQCDSCPKWHPSIHMPKEAARLFLRVTEVRVERLQDGFFIQGDTIAALYDEGIDIGEQCRQCIESYGNPCCNDLELEPDENGEDENGGSECGMLDEVRSDFARLWNSTIKPADLPLYGWESNPWVWVIKFERISKEAAIGGGGDG